MTDLRARFNVTERSHGARPMLFAHGFGCDQSMWREVAPSFEADHRVVLFDFIGAGDSDLSAYDPARHRALDGYADDVLDLCRALALDDVVFVGHSVASMIGVLAANKEPGRFRELVLVGPSPRYLNDDGYHGGFDREDIDGLLGMMEKNYGGWAEALAPVIMKNPDRPGLTAELEARFCATDPDIARDFAAVTFLSDNRADLAAVTVPSLILQCTDDAIAPEPVGQYLHEHLPGSTLHQLAATGHCPHLSHPGETAAAIRAYLDGRTGAA
ncbi:alpha/beta fold hydrolase [Rubrivirga sp. IMCC45206]|uniref:alpha/beta fold hydrolase n=1 Tax=Rubrivirga sp. IMCC45206 TaxID=3391614 RepID=UPI00398FD211